MAVTLTSKTNQKSDENNNNETSINLGDCEQILRKVYNISNNETLFKNRCHRRRNHDTKN